MALHVMLDLETLSLRRNALILSIGAVKFDPNQPRIDGLPQFAEAFYVCIDPKQPNTYGRHIDPGTVDWWMHEDRAVARAALLGAQRMDLATAIEAFTIWYGNEPLPVWGNGAGFDNEVIKDTYEALNQLVPWSYREDRCYRTLKSLAPGIPVPKIGVAHQALDDASAQAAHLQDIVQHLGLTL